MCLIFCRLNIFHSDCQFKPFHDFDHKKITLKISFQIRIPKFKIEQQNILNDPLKAMGLTDVFRPGANLSKISTSEDIYVSTVVHKAFIEVVFAMVYVYVYGV